MPNLELCRVCLCSIENAHSIRNSQLQIIYQHLTNYKLATDDGRPETVCHICYHQLQRFCRFRDKSQKSEEIITQLLHHGIEISVETVSVLKQVIPPQFCVTPVESSVYRCPQSSGVYVKEEPVDVQNDLQKSRDTEVTNIPQQFCVTPVESSVYHCPQSSGAYVKEEPVDVQNDLQKSRDTEVTNDIVENSGAVCRVCLGGGIRTHSINNSLLQVIYDKLTNTKLKTEGRPVTVCYICRRQLIKCRTFLNTCRKSDNILTELFKNGIQLSQDTITILNTRIKPNFTVSAMTSYSYRPNKDSTIQKKNQQPSLINNNNTSIKEDPDLYCEECSFKALSSKQLEWHLRFHDPNRNFPCDICSYRFNRAQSLKIHKNNIHKKNFQCGKCNKKFESIRKLKMHLITHTTKDILKCESCNKIFKNRADKRHHLYKFHSNDIYPCGMCDVTFRTKEWLLDHIFLVHTGKFPFYICDICNKRFADKSCMKKHIMFVHMKLNKYTCYVCDITVYSTGALRQHMNSHAPIKRYKCKFCPKTFHSKYHMTIHIRRHTGERPYKCKICKKGYTDKYILKHHLKTHAGIRFICDFCGKKYAMKYNLKEHMQTHMTTKKICACNHCDKTYIFKKSFLVHMETHNKISKVNQKFTCEICNKQVTDLKQHIKVHTREKPFDCSKCDKRFAYKCNLTEHIKTHYDKKPYTCDICDKRFRNKPQLKNHIKNHSEVKPYSCEVCDKSFKQTNQLRVHNRTHTGEKLFPCNQCDKSFGEKRALDCHKTNVHLDELKYYICNLCNRTFTEMNDLIHHIKSHKGSKPYKCVCNKTCKQSFSKLTQFAEHMRTHLADMKRDCILCNRTFWKYNIRRHLITVHNGFKPYGCNICEATFRTVLELNTHVNVTHKGDKPYHCEICDAYFSRGRSLKEHRNRQGHIEKMNLLNKKKRKS